ncbi:hypothetical protein HA050_17275 [Iodobacter sp. HSC-16F04]|uniref:Uncharacterized protein n=1 Tax=Iodobacter violaceini TaxID=3044271 RepID=A0ABX0KT74_9NEIS|nr:hypothetical protein [Iodobacter violacea]NHQ87863.1 hypothetical protein [Iodobacter violacea]
MRKEFSHRVDDQLDGYIPFNTDTPDGATIFMKVDEAGNFCLSANADGFLHMARICAELALGNFPCGYHFHKNFNFKHSLDEAGTQFTFRLVELGEL